MPDIDATLAERGARYGDFTDHADVAQQLQDVIRFDGTTPRVGWAKLSAVQRQALTVIADKIARILTGDPDYTDNWHDIQGYAKLAEDRCVDKTLPQLDLSNTEVVQHSSEAFLRDEFAGWSTGMVLGEQGKAEDKLDAQYRGDIGGQPDGGGAPGR